MATQYQTRGGTTAETLLFTGAQRELTVDTDLNAVVVHDGITAGGFYTATSTQVKNGTFYFNEDAGSAADAYILVPKANTNAPSAYLDGVQFGFVTTHPNTGPSTANFMGLGVKNLKFPGGIDPIAGEISGRVYLIYDATNGWLEIQRKASGAQPQLRTISGAVATNALTVTLAPCTIDFRASTLASGVIQTRNVAATISVVAPNGATLGTNNAVAARIVVLAIFGPVNVELALVNLSGGLNLDETTLINTTAISAASTSSNVVYSTTARAAVPFRVVGFVDSTQATAGVWSSAPSTVQGAGGQALVTLSQFGRWQVLGGARVAGTTYVNTTGRVLFVGVTVTNTGSSSGFGLSMLVTPTGSAGLTFTSSPTQSIGAGNMLISLMVPVGPGDSYAVTVTNSTITFWNEFR